MRRLDRYLLRELMVPLGYCLAGLVLFLITADLFANLSQYQRWKMHGNDIAQYYFLNLPGMLVFVLPISLLLALLYSLTNHARHNEITAMRAAGISLWRLCLPYFAVGLASTVLLYVMNEYWAPSATDAAEALKTRRIQKNLPPANKISSFTFKNPRGRRNWIAESYDTKTGEMIAPKVLWSLENGSARWLWAGHAAWTNSQWVFYDIDIFDDDPGKNPFLVPLLRTNAFAMPAFIETPGEINNYLKLSEAFSSLPTRGTKRSDISIKKVRQYLRFNPDPERSVACRLYTDLYGRQATPWTCLVVVLIAIPFGAGQGRRNVFVGVASSITICVIYFVLQQLGLMFGNIGAVSPWLAAWLPNLVFAAAGIWLSTRVR
jgi:lipopolysaccharide export system permease protein